MGSGRWWIAGIDGLMRMVCWLVIVGGLAGHRGWSRAPNIERIS